MNKITVIGISDSSPQFSEEVKLLIQKGKKFAGGKRHLELVENLLPESSEWFSIVVPLKSLFDKIKETSDSWIVFASGDPLFFGIANTLKREIPDAKLDIFSTFNSLQTLAHRIGLAYGEYRTISLTGRPFHNFDKALIQGVDKMGVLTDRRNTPVTIAQRMINFGYSNYRMFYGEHMGGAKERVLELSLEEALTLEFNHPNCLYLQKTDSVTPKKGIPELEFEPLDGRPNMITKMPIRLTTLALMKLESRSVLWDIGACTGSISIETRLNYPDMKVKAFEIREESKGIIERNSQKFKTPGIEFFSGDYLKCDKTNIESPDAIFLGGYGGKMDAVLDDADSYLKDGGVVAFNSVSEKSRDAFINWCKKSNYTISNQVLMSVDSHNPVTVFIANK